MNWLIDFAKAGCVYVPAFILGRYLCDQFSLDPYWVGWMLGGTAFYIRLFGPKFIRIMP